ncbi:hypothetical protein MASR1M45_29470 [Candidatus Kapaibacterium sp.]
MQIQIPENCYDIVLNTDNELLHKILWHLTDNAIKFTENGVITIGTKLLDGAVEIFTAVIMVKDMINRNHYTIVEDVVEQGYEGKGLTFLLLAVS